MLDCVAAAAAASRRAFCSAVQHALLLPAAWDRHQGPVQLALVVPSHSHIPLLHLLYPHSASMEHSPPPGATANRGTSMSSVRYASAWWCIHSRVGCEGGSHPMEELSLCWYTLTQSMR